MGEEALKADWIVTPFMLPNFEELLRRAMGDNAEILKALEEYDRKDKRI